MLSAVLLLAAAQPDSAAALRSAQRAQQDFEWRRGLLAPRTLGSRDGACDERIGRFCYWYDGDVVPLPPEPDEIKVARNRMLAVLDSAAALLPGDWWIAGERVRYLVESDRLAEAFAAARACHAERWWCEALDGFARHAAGDDAAADTVYAAALADMPDDLRCRWTDLTPLLAGELLRRYTKLDCEGRAALTAHLWWLAQPLLSRAGNDRRVEHYSRLTMVRMLERAGSAWSSPLGDDLRELTLRYGWPVAWSGEVSTTQLIDPRIITGHERQPAFHFFPDVEPTPDQRVAAWTLLPPRPRERYAPLYATSWETLSPDMAVFRRRDSTLLVVAFDLTRDTLWQGTSPRLAAVLLGDERTTPVVARDERAGMRGVLVAAAPWPATLAAFEVTLDATRRAGRARVPIPPRNPAVIELSDPLVFDPVGPADSLPQDLAAVLPLVHGPARVPHGARIGVYWETYGSAPNEVLETAVHVAPLSTGLLRRVGDWLGLGKRSRETSLSWREVAQPARGVASRSVTVDITSLDPGRYRVAVTVGARGEHVTATRELEIVRP